MRKAEKAARKYGKAATTKEVAATEEQVPIAGASVYRPKNQATTKNEDQVVHQAGEVTQENEKVAKDTKKKEKKERKEPV